MPLDLAIVPRAHWLSRVRSCLRLLIIVLSGAVVCMLVHTLEIYRGNRYLDLRSGEIPMTWPAHTNLAPTIVLLAIAAANFLASVAILSLSLKRSFRRPIRSRDAYRIIAGSFGVILWITAIVVFHLLDKASKASLGRYSCTNKNVLSNGRFQYRAVCEEQVSLSQPQPQPHPPATANNTSGRRILHCHWRRNSRDPHSRHPRRVRHPLSQEPRTRTHATNTRQEAFNQLRLAAALQAPKTLALNSLIRFVPFYNVHFLFPYVAAMIPWLSSV